MQAILAHIRPLNIRTGQRVDVRIASTGNPAAQGLGGFVWESALFRRPRTSIELFAMDLAPGLRLATGDFEITLSGIKEVDPSALYWSGAEIKVYRVDDLAWPAVPELSGRVTKPVRNLDTDRLTLDIQADSAPLDKPLLVNEFDGSGGINGGPEMRGVLRPAGFGHCFNLEPLMFDTVRNIAQVDGYGNTLGIDWCAEGLSSFGPSVGDYADYAALAAAVDAKAVPPGRWATCIASGLIALGAPPAGVITCHVRFGFGLSGALMRRAILVHAGVPVANVVSASFDALDQAVPYLVHYWTKDQRTVRDLIEAVASGCNAAPVVTFQNTIIVTRPFGGVSIGQFNRFGYSHPRVRTWATKDPPVPYWRIKARAARPIRVLETDEVNYEDTIVDRGVYDPNETYRAGNLVWTAQGAQFIYTNAIAGKGNPPPPNDPLNAWWRRRQESTTAQVADAYRAPVPIAAGATFSKGQVGTDQGARWTYTSGAAWDGTKPPTLPAQTNAYWTLILDAAVVVLTTNIAAINLRADYRNVVLDGQLPQNGKATLQVGSVDASANAQWLAITSGCTATVAADGAFSVTAVTASGYVDIRATYNNIAYTRRITITLSQGQMPPGGSNTASVQSFPSVSTTTYPAAPSVTTTLAAGATGKISFAVSLEYEVATTDKFRASATVYGKVVYRATGASVWTDAGAEIAGSEAYATAAPDFDSGPGQIYKDAINVTGLTAATVYEFGILLRRTGNRPTQPSGYLTGTTS